MKGNSSVGSKDKMLICGGLGIPSVKKHAELCFGVPNKVSVIRSMWGENYTDNRLNKLIQLTDPYYKTFIKNELRQALEQCEQNYLANPTNPYRVIILVQYLILVRMHMQGLLLDNKDNRGTVHLKVPRVEEKVSDLRHGSFAQVKAHWQKDRKKLIMGDSHHGLYALDYLFMADTLSDEDLQNNPVALAIEYYTPENFNTDIGLINDVCPRTLKEKMTDKSVALGFWMNQFKKATNRYKGLTYNHHFDSSILALMYHLREETIKQGSNPILDYRACYKQKDKMENYLDVPIHTVGDYPADLLKKISDAYSVVMRILFDAQGRISSKPHREKLRNATGFPILMMCDMLNPESHRKMIQNRKTATVGKIIANNINDLAMVITRLTQGGGISVNTDLVFQLLNH